jgi:threonine aldolase
VEKYKLMSELDRRGFLKMSAIGPMIFSGNNFANGKSIQEKSQVHFNADGLNLSPQQYTRLLLEIIEKKGIKDDYYSQKGVVAELEEKFAMALGKESAIYMPTGTLANQIAIRTLCGTKQKALVQLESHIYNDSGDAVQTLNNINLIPLGGTNATFSLKEVQETLERTKSGRVATQIGAISIESPVRRKTGQVFDFSEMKKIAAFAKENNIKTHLDGARIYLASAYSGIGVKEYTSLFDTVYVSLYKYFNAASGAILAGEKSLIEPLFHVRRMFGSGLHQSWPFAAVALHYFDGFEERYAKSVKKSEEFLKKLSENERFKVKRIENGTNISQIEISGTSAEIFAQNLLKKNILLTPRNEKTINLLANESILNIELDELLESFVKAV